MNLGFEFQLFSNFLCTSIGGDMPRKDRDAIMEEFLIWCCVLITIDVWVMGLDVLHGVAINFMKTDDIKILRDID